MTATRTENPIEVLFSAEDIAHRLDSLSQEIAAAEVTNLLVIPILKGSFVFAADLIRALNRAGLAPEVDFLTLSSYKKSRNSSGQVSILRDLDLEV
ncbi:MAG: phosphoribosyltransferase, partial [Hyphomicrobium sp.]